MDADSTLHLQTASSVSAATRVSVSATATATATAPAEVSPLILSNTSSSLKLGLEGSYTTATKSSRNRLSGADKIESVHESIDDARAAIELLSNLTSFLDTVANDSNRSLMNSVGDAINVCRSILDRHVNTVSILVNNTKEKRSSKQAHSKLTKTKKLEGQHAKLEMNRSMKCDPKFTLKAAINRAKLSLNKNGGCLRGSAESTLASTSLPPRQSKKIRTPEGDDEAHRLVMLKI